MQQFTALLGKDDELARVSRVVDPHLEIAAIINTVCKSRGGGPALFFENVRGHDIPLAANLFGSRRRMALASGLGDIEDLANRIRADLALTGARDSTLALQSAVSGRPEQVVFVDDAACFEVDVTASGVTALPALQSWPGDGGRYLTLGQVFTYHPETSSGNCGMYRMQLVEPHKLLLRCHAGSGGAEHLAAWHARREAMPIVVALGGPPIMTWLAGVPLPGGVAETAFAGYLTAQPLPMARCQDRRLAVPASTDILIEGSIFPGEQEMEGPFGNHTGSYGSITPAPVIRIIKISRRRDAIYPCTLVGPPPMENASLAEMTLHILLPLLQFDHPWVLDVHMPPQGIFHRAAMVAVAPDCQRTLDEMGRALWASALLKNSRLLILLDADVALRDFAEVYWRVINAGPWSGSCRGDGHKMLLDARAPAGDRRVKPDPEIIRKVRAQWPEYELDDIKLNHE